MDRGWFQRGRWNEDKHWHQRAGRVLRPGRMPQGHQSVVLTKKGGSHCVHALVLAAFVGPRPPGMDVRHLDGNPANNLLENLAYGTRSENCMDALRHGRRDHVLAAIRRRAAKWIEYQGRRWTLIEFWEAFCRGYKHPSSVYQRLRAGDTPDAVISRAAQIAGTRGAA